MIKIKELYEIKKDEGEKVIETFLDAFSEYPKMDIAFPTEREKNLAKEATLRFYTAFDVCFGKMYSLDSHINECVCLVHSDDMNYNEEQYVRAQCYSEKYRSIMKQLGEQGQKTWEQFFEELDRLEGQLEFPYPHLYLDFLGVKTAFQRQGRGRRLMETVCKYAQEQGLPMMLFTNTAEDVAFYESLGFQVVGVARSEKFGFENTYLVKGV